MYAVLGRRNGRVLHADMQEGSQTFHVIAELPVIESFDFANEIRKKTNGEISEEFGIVEDPPHVILRSDLNMRRIAARHVSLRLLVSEIEDIIEGSCFESEKGRCRALDSGYEHCSNRSLTEVLSAVKEFVG
ncbi:hypothetical protein TNCV_1020441 [Trichonephila clavipes]|nr:hypothetical protein TNCV_1020441 [Trichonephila clavipes]